jgi:hypothetical protein
MIFTCQFSITSLFSINLLAECSKSAKIIFKRACDGCIEWLMIFSFLSLSLHSIRESLKNAHFPFHSSQAFLSKTSNNSESSIASGILICSSALLSAF